MQYNENLGFHILNWCNEHGVEFLGIEERGFCYRKEGDIPHYMSFERFSEI